MPFELRYTPEANQQYDALSRAKNLVPQFKAVKKALRLLQDDPTHPGLRTHKYDSLVGPGNTEVFEAYAQNRTPGAYRIFWCYYPPKKKDKAEKGKTVPSKKLALHVARVTAKEDEKPATITVISITPHP